MPFTNRILFIFTAVPSYIIVSNNIPNAPIFLYIKLESNVTYESWVA